MVIFPQIISNLCGICAEVAVITIFLVRKIVKCKYQIANEFEHDTNCQKVTAEVIVTINKADKE
ncbi:hypothetical protein GCM10011628_12200 [Lactobacillus acetotolerans DSM 20749 = JCM 3825]|nr:hypothetical protein GCM10011628_12200 [Lactobacillus acetotolerans DSM 20749 = JCM 3825]